MTDIEPRVPLSGLTCEDCGALSPEDAVGHIAIHDCEKGEWLIVSLTLPEAQPQTD